MNRRRHPPLLLVAAAFIAAATSLLPVVYLADQAFVEGAANYFDEIWQSRTAELLVRSLGLAAVVTALCVFVGVASALAITRIALPFPRLINGLLVAPLAVPSYVAAYVWISHRSELAGFWGAVLVLTSVSYPYVYLPVKAALERVDPAFEEVARSLGRTPLQALFVTLGQVRSSISAGALLVALYVLSDFGAVATMRYEAFTFVIYGAYRAGFNPSRAAALSSVLIAAALVLVVLESRARGRATSRVGAGAARDRAKTGARSVRAGAATWFTALLTVTLAVPVGTLITWLLKAPNAEVEAADVASAAWTTLRLGVYATVVTVALALPLGYLAARFRSPLTSTLERATYVSHALPGIVIAISMIYVGIRLLDRFYLRTPLLVLTYAVLFLPLAAGAVRSTIEQTPRRLEEVARSLGRSPMQAFRAVTLPLSAPGVGAGAALVAVTAMKELPATLLLRPTGMETLSMELWKYTVVSDYASAAPYAALLVLIAAVPVYLLGRWQNGSS